MRQHIVDCRATPPRWEMMLNYRAIFIGALQLLSITTVLMLLVLWAGVERATGPQVLTLSALLIWPGVYSGIRAKDSGILHGLLTGLLGALFVAICMTLVDHFFGNLPLLDQLAAKRFLLIGILCGLWGGIGGMFSDIIRIKRLSKKNKAGN